MGGCANGFVHPGEEEEDNKFGVAEIGFVNPHDHERVFVMKNSGDRGKEDIKIPSRRFIYR
jgi:hypothetical protein